MANRPERPDRLEREINEILEKIDSFPTPAERRSRKSSKKLKGVGDAVSSGSRGVTRELSRISLSQVMLLAFLLILGSLFLRAFLPFAWPWLMYAGIVLFVTAFVLMIFGGGRGGGGGGQSTHQYWRGRPVSYRPDGLSSRMRRWWGRQKR